MAIPSGAKELPALRAARIRAPRAAARSLSRLMDP
jgi:hypothetical protein